METEETRALIKTYYETLPMGDREKLSALFAENIEWYPPKSAPLDIIKGRDAVTEELGGASPKRFFDMKTFRVKVHSMLADGATAVVQQTISATTHDGEQYDNEYCWVYHCSHGQIEKIEEYSDTYKAWKLMKWED